MSGTQSLRSDITNGTNTQYPKSEQAERDAENRISDADMVVLTDGDADGIAAASLVNYVYNGLDVEIIPVGPHRPMLWEGQALDALRKHGRESMTVFFLDTCLADTPSWAVDKLGYLPDEMNVHFFDHHEWPDEGRREFVEGNTTYCEIDSEVDSRTWEIGGEEVEERCTTQMVYDYFVDNEVDFPDTIENRVKAIAAGDLWLRKDTEEGFIHPQTATLIDSLEYVTDRKPSERSEEDWYGYKTWADSIVSDSQISETEIPGLAHDYRNRIDRIVDFVYDNSDQFMSVKEINGMKFASIYGDVPPNDIAERLRQDGFDGVAILRPNFRVSFRGTDQFAVCDKIATELGGGGHEQASGAGLNTLTDGEMDETEYQNNHGEPLRSEVLEVMASHL